MIGVSIEWGYLEIRMVYFHGKSQLEMYDDWGYDIWSYPPHGWLPSWLTVYHLDWSTLFNMVFVQRRCWPSFFHQIRYVFHQLKALLDQFGSQSRILCWEWAWKRHPPEKYGPSAHFPNKNTEGSQGQPRAANSTWMSRHLCRKKSLCGWPIDHPARSD